ncbi:MAG: carbohydrate binding family 9 domain-containing protein [Candidatus Aminicenantes bacterium]|nr:carbohydrate binding family 9 domain-containing protein [Candidatus Aminicenantes bacterium]
MTRAALKGHIERIFDSLSIKPFCPVISFIVILCLLIGLPLSAYPVSIGPHEESKTAPKPVDIPKLSHPPKIDGKFDNPLWEQEALRIDDFLQFVPKEKGEPSQKTVAWLGYDKKNLYVAIRAYDSESEKLRYCVTTRDNCMEDDWVFVSIDTFNEKRRSYFLILNPLGIQMDMLRLEEGGNDNMDESWDMVFFSDGRVDDEGFYVEMAVPFKSIRFPDAERKVWSVIVGRTIARTGEIVSWPHMSQSKPGLLTQAREMVIEGAVEKGSNFEIMPVATSLTTKEKSINFQPGVNFKWGINSNMTMDLTANPDFSHIEADAPQIDINQRFALYYNEKRPFFLEGMEIFRFPDLDMVYTRRIIDPIGGAKLTGKAGRFTYGVLSALDTDPTSSLWNISGAAADDENLGNALFNVFRVKADVFKESYIGFAVTDKEMNGSWNRVAGFDGQLKFKNSWFLSFQAMGSKTKYEGGTTALAPALYLDFSYFSKKWSLGTYGLALHPDFEASAGFVNRTDYRTVGIFAGRRFFPEKKNFQRVDLYLNAGRRYGYSEDIMQDEWLRGEVLFRFTEFSMVEIEYCNQMERYGGIDFRRNKLEIGGELQFVKWMPFGFYFETGESIWYDEADPFLGWANTYSLYAAFKPSRRMRMAFEFSKQTFWEEWGGEQIFDYNVLRTRLTYQISKQIGLRTIVDYNHYYKKVYGSFLFSWVLRPGTLFYLGVDNNMIQNDSGRYINDNYSVFLKFSYWFRL